MRAARYHGPGDVRVEDVPEPSAGPGEVLLRIRACSTCGTDAKAYRFGHHQMDPPVVMGHEIAGKVVEVGAGVDEWSPGDRVECIAALPCGECHECRHGWRNICTNLKTIGFEYDGAMAELMTVPQRAMLAGGLHRVPDNVSFVEASVAEPLACAINAQDLARVGETEGETVVVFGPGPIGALHVRLARARGAAKVVLIGRRRPRLDMTVERVHPDLAVVSEETDPVEAVLELTGGRGADVVITAAGSGQAQEQAVEMAARRGRISLFGGLPRDNPTITLDSNKVHYRELTIVGASASLPEQHGRALEMIGSGAIPVADLVTHRLPLERAIEGIETVISGDGIKVTIEP